MSVTDNEWGINDVNISGEDSGQEVSEAEYGEAMPAKEITANLSEAMSREIVEDAVVKGIVKDDAEGDIEGIVLSDSEFDISDEEILNGKRNRDKASKLVKNTNPGDIHHHRKNVQKSDKGSERYSEKYSDKYSEKHNEKTSGSKRNDSYDEDDEDELGNNKIFLAAMAVVGIIIIIVLGLLLVSLSGKNKKPSTGEDNDYEIVDIAHGGNSDNGSNDNSDASGDVNNDKPTDTSDKNDADKDNADKDKKDNKSTEVTECDKNGHDYADATCTKPMTCKVCGQTRGDALGHDFSAASCEEEAVCSKCGEKGTTSLGHNFTPASCTEPKTCSRCKLTEGEPLGHDYEEATCEKPATCKRCNETTGEKSDHHFEEVSSKTEDGVKTVNYKCKDCGEEKTEVLDSEKPLSPEEYAKKVIELVNKDREANGLKPLAASPDLMTAANIRAQEIATSFSHTRPDGTDCVTVFEQNEIVYTLCGENIAAGQNTPENVEMSWMNSDGHRANILNAGYNRIGVGFYSGGTYGFYWVQLFAD